jgi:hypothetical protein
MADTFTTMDDVTKVALAEFHNNLALVGAANKQYQPEFLDGHWDKGETIRVRKPNKGIITDGAPIVSIPDEEERTVPITLSYRKKAVMDFTTKDLTLYTATDFTERFIKPRVLQLANEVEYVVGTELFNGVYNHLGTAGVSPTSYGDLSKLKAFVNKLGIPEQHMLAMQEDNYAELIANSNLQNSFLTSLNKDISVNYRAGVLSAMEIFHTFFVPPHIAGIGDVTATPANGYVAAGTVKTDVSNGATTITITGLGTETGVFEKGDKIKIPAFYSVNPIRTNIQTGEPIEFTVTADTDSVSGDAVVPISPTVRHLATDPYQNVNAQITAGSPVLLASANTGVGSDGKVPYKTNVAFYKDAIQFAAPPLEIPKSVVPAAAGRQVDPETGISIRLIEFYDGIQDKTITRMDILFGVLINAEYAVALLG